MRRTGRRRRVLAAFAAAVALAVALSVLAAAFMDTGERHELVRFAKQVGPTNVRIALKDGGRPVAFDSRGLRLRGGLYAPGAAGALPGIVLVHGSVLDGRMSGLYALLADRMAARCYVVLSFDLPGFGQSEDPDPIDDVEAWDAPDDIRAAVDYMAALPIVDPRRIYLIGHSLGGSYALGAAARDRRVRGLAALSPARRIDTRVLAEGAPDRLYYYSIFFRDRALKGSVPMDVFLRIVASWGAEAYLDAYSGTDHPPVLFVDGARERDRASLAAFVEKVGGPKRHVTIPNADHFNNVREFRGLILYDRAAFGRLVDEIDRWFGGGAAPRC